MLGTVHINDLVYGMVWYQLSTQYNIVYVFIRYLPYFTERWIPRIAVPPQTFHVHDEISPLLGMYGTNCYIHEPKNLMHITGLCL